MCIRDRSASARERARESSHRLAHVLVRAHVAVEADLDDTILPDERLEVGDLVVSPLLALPVPDSSQPQTRQTEARRARLSLIHISEPTRQAEISYAVFCLKKKTRATANRVRASSPASPAAD